MPRCCIAIESASDGTGNGIMNVLHRKAPLWTTDAREGACRSCKSSRHGASGVSKYMVL